MPRKKLVAGNWKMNTTLAEARALAAAVAAGTTPASADVAVCPPFPWLLPVAEVLRGSVVALGAQNCHPQKSGAYTGEVSTGMLLEAGCKYVIVGHSERRHGLGETDPFLNEKAKAALSAGLHVIFCVGELLAEREANQTEAVLDRQATQGLRDLPADRLGNLVVAYEPVWAIGTGKVATPEQAQDAHAFIRKKVGVILGENVARSLPILYGGSVTADSAAGLFDRPDVDGGLVGGASLKADSFLKIIQAAG
ncbi:MAG: pgk tpi [Gemmataceae bacterium]|nr:pgk tpi [Gemmataceae bacterium]